jgi:hypothetical protein
MTESVFKTITESTGIGVVGVFEGNERFGLPRVEDMDLLIDQVEHVLIFDLAYSDYGTLRNLVRNSVHVYVESLNLLSNSELRQLQKLADEAGVIVQVGLKNRYAPHMDYMAENQFSPRIIESNRYVRLSSNSTHLSVLDDLLFNDIDLVMSCIHSPIKQVNANGVGVVFKDPDVINARIEFYNGAVANLSASKISGRDVHKVRLFRNLTFLEVDFVRTQIAIMDGSMVTDETDADDAKLANRELSGRFGPQQILETELKSFYHCTQYGREPKAGINQLLETRQATDAIVDQLERNFSYT